MTRNPNLKVFVANGFYELATPYFATQYTFDHLGLDPSLSHNISMGYYEAGHMMYIQLASLMQLKEDLREFILSAMP
jgi:carboxypeptidase C (cathepsin A)